MSLITFTATDKPAGETMRRLWRRYWPIVLVIIASGAIVAVHVYLGPPELSAPLPPFEANYSQVEAGLFIGASVKAPPAGTQAVLNLCEIEDPYQVEFHRWQQIPDADPAPSLEWLRQQVEFVDSQRRAGRQVYIHCAAGVSRAAMVTTAYLMAQRGWSRDQALTFLSSKRPVIDPNLAFRKLLLEWEQELKTIRKHSHGN